MSVFRIKKTENFVVIHKGALEDPNLSFKAKGLWAYCMSRPNDWTFKIKHLSTVSKEGKEAITTAIHELEEAGYIKKVQKTINGRFQPVDYEVHETSQIKKMFSQPDFPVAEKPLAENPPLLSIEQELRIEETNKESAKPTPPFPPDPKPNQPKEIPQEASETAKKLHEKVLAIHPKLKPPKLDFWAIEIEKLNRVDGHSWDKINSMIDWAFDDAFWVKVIQSPSGLRKHWDKMAIQQMPFNNKGIIEKRNRDFAQGVKSHLSKTGRGALLWVANDFVRNTKTGDTINVDLNSETFENVLLKWFDLEKE